MNKTLIYLTFNIFNFDINKTNKIFNCISII